MRPDNMGRKLCYLYGNPAFGELVDLLGEADAVKLIQIFGGTRIRVPSHEEVGRMAQDYRIFEDIRRGLRIVDIAKKYGVSVHNVQVIKKKFRQIFTRGVSVDRAVKDLAGNKR